MIKSALVVRIQMRVEGRSCRVLANEYSCAHHVTWSPNKLWRSTSIFNLWYKPKGGKATPPPPILSPPEPGSGGEKKYTPSIACHIKLAPVEFCGRIFGQFPTLSRSPHTAPSPPCCTISTTYHSYKPRVMFLVIVDLFT